MSAVRFFNFFVSKMDEMMTVYFHSFIKTIPLKPTFTLTRHTPHLLSSGDLKPVYPSLSPSRSLRTVSALSPDRSRISNAFLRLVLSAHARSVTIAVALSLRPRSLGHDHGRSPHEHLRLPLSTSSSSTRLHFSFFVLFCLCGSG
ncbi:hypothetical protein ZOSMA_207G00300 [Zostera marina]|uniref:Uncharacterized protein n=1 Tax=Zostera marina TaxID=29655 RepID=A0A0K9PL51_ZOSMR|nr:hypothetical protein ZOSMA_207G00300 [Zostera marina]